MRKVFVSDFTLKQLAAERKNPLLFREKVATATAIDSMNVDTIELAPVVNYKEDRIICKTIATAIKNASVAIPVGTTEEEVNQAWECISSASKPVLQIVLPLSTVQMEYSFHIKAAKMMPIIEKLVKASKEKCENVEFIALDATRAEEKVLFEAINIAVTNGATAVTLCDDAGTMFPVEFAAFVKKVKEITSVPVYVKVSNKLFMKTAAAFESLKAGADGIKTVAEGKNQLKTDEICSVIAARGESFGLYTDIDETRIHSDIKSLEKKVDSTEIPDTAAAENKADITLNADSSIEKITSSAAKLGYSLTEEDAGNVLRGLKRICEKKSSVGTKEFEALIASYAMQAPSTYHLESYTANSSNLSASIAYVVLTKDSESKITGTGVGDGPIDAAFGAIENGIGYHYELEDFQINTVTQGKESLGSALIKLRSNGKLYAGNGISTDIVGACIRAYINALNKIIYDGDE